MKTTVRHRVLCQAESANDAQNLSYRPTEQYASTTVKLAEDGLLRRGQMGGWFLTEEGRRQLARERTAKNSLHVR